METAIKVVGLVLSAVNVLINFARFISERGQRNERNKHTKK